MKILFIYSYNYIEPVGLMYLSSSLRAAGHETFFYDLTLSRGLEAYVARIRPGVIAYSIVTGTHHHYAALNRELKQRFSFQALFGGPHATFFPEFVQEEGVDFICRGEGEQAVVELVTDLSGGGSGLQVANIWAGQGGTVHRNDLRPFVADLDTLPFPDRALVYGYDAYRLRGNKYVLSTRGCPFDCTYCFNHSLKKLYQGKGAFCRRRSIDNVLQEVDELCRTAPVATVHFFDDVFILDKPWVLEFCERYRREIAKPFICYVRVNLVDEQIVAALKAAGVVTITYAIEAGNEHLRNHVLKRRISVEQIVRAADLFNKYNIPTFTQNMLGLPGETLAQAFETVRLNARCRPSVPIASIFQPYPGTELTAYAREHGWYDGDTDIDHDSFYEKSLLVSPERRQHENLAWLFAPAVRLAAFESLVRVLIGLPFGRLYKIIWHVSRAWGYFFKINWIPVRDVVRVLRRRRKTGGVPGVE